MPEQIKDEEKYERLKEQGMSKEKAARIANSGKASSRKGGKSDKYEEWKKDDLLEKAQSVGIRNYSKMNKDELIDALRNH